MRERSSFAQNGQVNAREGHCAEQRPQMSCRSALGVITAKSGSHPQNGQCAVLPRRQVGALRQHLGAAREKRPQREHEHLIEAAGGPSGWRRRPAPDVAVYHCATSGSSALPSRRERDDRVV